jgi:hypothetical protein
MRGLIALLLASWPAMAGTVIQETAIRGPNGALATGKIEISLTVPLTALSGVRVETRIDAFAIVNGRLSVTLEPNDTATPAGTQYWVTWKIDGARPRTEPWTVPTTAAVLRVEDVAMPASMITMGAPTRLIPSSINPGCATSADWGRQWLDNSAATDVLKVCMKTGGVLGWVTK